MNTTIYDKLSSLVKESKQSNTDVSVKNYDLKCNNKAVCSFDYELNLDEETLLDFIYDADNLGFSEEMSNLIQNKISLDTQKLFFTKLFIHEKLSEEEKASSVSCGEYVPKLNTGAYDKKPKSVEQLLETYGASCLITDKEFRKTINAFKEMRILTNPTKDENVVTTKIKK